MNENQKAVAVQGNELNATPDNLGTSNANPQLELAAEIERAGAASLAQHAAEHKPSRKRGRPRSISMAQMGNSPSSTPVAQGQGTVLPVAFEMRTQSYDEEAAGALIDGGIEALNDVAAAFQRNAAISFTGDEKVAAAAAESARMSEKVKETVRTGALACFRKYAVELEYAPELTLLIGLGLWTVGNYVSYKRLKTTGQKLAQPTPGAN